MRITGGNARIGELTMSKILMGLCLALAVFQPAFADVRPLANSLAIEKESAIAFDPDGNRGLVVYAQNGYVYGRYVDANGVPVGTSEFTIFPVSFPASGRSYSTPSVTFKRGQNRFVITAAETGTNVIYTHSGPISISAPRGIAVTAFNADGTRAASRFLRTPIASVARSEKRPVVVADELSDGCCIAVAWEDETFSRSLYVQRLDANLLPQGETAVLTPSGAERIANVAAAYELNRDRFTFVYDMVDATSRRWVATTSMLAFTGGEVRQLNLAERVGHGERSGDLPRGTPALTASVGLNKYVIAWRVGDFLHGAFFSPDIGGASGRFALPTTTTRPALVPVSGARRVLVVSATTPALGSIATLNVYAIDSTVMSSAPPWIGTISRSADGAALSAAAVWSPLSRRLLATWDSAGPTRDVYVGDLVP